MDFTTLVSNLGEQHRDRTSSNSEALHPLSCLTLERADVAKSGLKKTSNKAVENLPALGKRVSEIIDNYLTVQQDILSSRPSLTAGSCESTTDNHRRGKAHSLPQARQLATTGRHARPRAVCASRQHLHPSGNSSHVIDELGSSPERSRSLPYDLSKLRAKRLIVKLPRSRRRIGSCRRDTQFVSSF
jgi:hypothetical protein